MRELKFKYYCKLSDNEDGRIIPLRVTLESIENTIDVMELLHESIEEILHNEHCKCSPSESFNDCDCERVWDGDFEIIGRCLCTGLTDNEGEVIYRADIVKLIQYTTRDGKNFDDLIAQVTFEDGMFLIDNEYARIVKGQKALVIGNIYQNPELLKNENA